MIRTDFPILFSEFEKQLYISGNLDKRGDVYKSFVENELEFGMRLSKINGRVVTNEKEINDIFLSVNR